MSLLIPFTFGWLLNKKAARVEVNISLAFLHWVGITLHPWPLVSDIAIFVLKGDVKLTKQPVGSNTVGCCSRAHCSSDSQCFSTDQTTPNNCPFLLGGPVPKAITVGDHATAVCIWNNLLLTVTSFATVNTFKKYLEISSFLRLIMTFCLDYTFVTVSLHFQLVIWHAKLVIFRPHHIHAVQRCSLLLQMPRGGNQKCDRLQCDCEI